MPVTSRFTSSDRQRALLASRRAVLLGALGAASAACRSTGSAPTDAKTNASASPSAQALGEVPTLAIKTAHERDVPPRGGTVIILLHGYGAEGDDLMPLAERLSRPKVRFFVPAAPFDASPSGRAWWPLGPGDRTSHAWDDQRPADYRDKPQVLLARRAVQNLLRDVRTRYAPERLVVAGFSQGGMLALDVALTADPPVDRVAALSSLLVAESLPALHAPRASKPLVFESHGRQDPILPFHAGEATSQLLRKYGHAVTFHPFDGGHAITLDVLEALQAFLFEGT